MIISITAQYIVALQLACSLMTINTKDRTYKCESTRCEIVFISIKTLRPMDSFKVDKKVCKELNLGTE